MGEWSLKSIRSYRFTSFHLGLVLQDGKSSDKKDVDLTLPAG
jgi:hypothetical protein